MKPDRTIRIQKLKDQGTEKDMEAYTPEERVGMVWQLTVDAWTFKGEPELVERRLLRHVVRVVRRGS